MDQTLIALVMIAAMLTAVFLRAPVALAMGGIGAAGYMALSSAPALLSYLSSAWPDKFMSYELAIVPLFILMGNIATRTGISARIFTASNAWIGHYRGGLAMASVAGCAMFGSISGSSLATASTMARVALPEMSRSGYSGALAAGSLAAGGTLGILIPPSVVLIIYAMLTQQNIVKLFLAATIPGTLAVIGFTLAIMIWVRLFPEEGPRHARASLKTRLRALAGVWYVVAIFGGVLGGIYGGLFTPAEGASVGVVAIALAGVLTRALGPKVLLECLIDTAVSSAMIFAIVFGADLFNVALTLSRLPVALADWVGAMGLGAMTVLLLMIVFYLLMGCVMDSLSMILLTVPVFFPTVMSLDFGLTPEAQAIWFGILTLVVVELGMITPPVGMNLFVIRAMSREISLGQIFRGTTPFIVSEFSRIALLVAFPGLSYWLVQILN
ncbi:C4-dicarboxylate ABC transporter permease [Rhodobacter sp. TJ_12]|uniref:TRAP transporter large permease n=1 Tax=Rhodobacter sp. TJ_12 TaxID=2029399 RepID=UPI001CC0C8A1|nr:TRAP transporter large permease [Rhodobacter sp. TJ_12]MBZ4021523.1 C4-dicarboxylate ABC transporter permease [Rhodobacter sp. TJ_12]